MLKTRNLPLWKLALLLYPFCAAAVAINLFLASLIGQNLGWPVLSPLRAVYFAQALGLPATWRAAVWVQGMIAQAER